MLTNEFWITATFWLHLGAAFCAAALAIWLWQKSVRTGERMRTLIIALALTSFWALAIASEGSADPIVIFAETIRNATWLALMYNMLRSNGHKEKPKTVIAIYGVLAGLLVVQVAIDIFFFIYSDTPQAEALLFYGGVLMRMLFAIGALVLVHNLYTMSYASLQLRMRMQIVALAAIWGYDLNLYTVTYLAGQVSPELYALRAIVTVSIVFMLAFGTHRGEVSKLHVSRSIAFQSFSLLAIGGYLAIMIIIAQALQLIGGDYARLAQISFVFGMSIAALLFLPSGRYRAWFKVKIAKHLFQHRYDYRAEWMRFTDTIGRPGDDAAPFHQRVIQAVADIPESPSGLLLTPNEYGRLELQARWNWPTLNVPANACNSATIPYFEDTGDIVELIKLRDGSDTYCNPAAIPDWLLEEESAWVLVPLVHINRLAGIVVLSRPPFTRKLDWEDFDMLRVVGRQVASYLAEEKGQEALLQARQFDEFNRRFAFVMHDIKNIVSQLSLVARNAEKHADNPEFRKDMVETLGGSVARMNSLLARLSQYGRLPAAELGEVSANDVISKIVAVKSIQHDVSSFCKDDVDVIADAQNLEQVLGHLIQNAVDASEEGEPVVVKSYKDGLHGCIEIFDSGSGMTAEFVRSELFKPFVSSKNDGFGIGAYEARTLVEAMHGRIQVESRPGEGSRFTIHLPLVQYKKTIPQNRKEEAA